ncbi:MAG: bifunctional helix-turn-helix domain-containing protein/methylated-DNA--[protein]-cysteine S-methyltransferase [Pseudomonadota bacterium]
MDGEKQIDCADAGPESGATPAAHRYALVDAAIRYLDAERDRRPSLEDLAAHIGYSPAHLQRVFTAHVGVSPKKYLSYLTLEHAKRLLRERRAVLDVSHASGLSSAGRLHDLFITWEAMSPGVYASGGHGLTLRRAWIDTPFGPAAALGSDAGLAGLAFAAEMGRAAAEADLSSRWPRARIQDDDGAVRAMAEAAFGGDGGKAHLTLIGAPFQIKVWEALLRIPSGHVCAYSDLAAEIGRPGASRAVGAAVGRNPISWLIPCHRALRKNGALGGYHWGLRVKRAMLAEETAALERSETPAP